MGGGGVERYDCRDSAVVDGGCDAYIPKPISVSDFLQTVERFANRVVA